MCSVNSNLSPDDTPEHSEVPPPLGSCQQCSDPIIDKNTAFRVKNEVYHQSCLTCHICHVILSTHIFFSLDGKFYCDADFSSVAVRCTVCENPIRERQVQMNGIAIMFQIRILFLSTILYYSILSLVRTLFRSPSKPF